MGGKSQTVQEYDRAQLKSMRSQLQVARHRPSTRPPSARNLTPGRALVDWWSPDHHVPSSRDAIGR